MPNSGAHQGSAMLVSVLAAVAAIQGFPGQQMSACNWEGTTWVCRNRTPPAPALVDPNATSRGFLDGAAAAAQIDRARREREAAGRQAYPSDPLPGPTLPATSDGDIPSGRITPADVYVSCYGLARGNGGETCSLSALVAIRDREGQVEGGEMRFCLPDTADVRINPTLAMGYAYIDFYDRVSPQNHTDDGFLAFIAAMIDKWPCA